MIFTVLETSYFLKEFKVISKHGKLPMKQMLFNKWKMQKRCFNRENSRVDWASSVLKQIVSGKEQQFRGSWESQFSQAVSNDDYASGILKLKNYAQQRANRITYLASSCKHMSELYKNLQLAKAMK